MSVKNQLRRTFAESVLVDSNNSFAEAASAVVKVEPVMKVSHCDAGVVEDDNGGYDDGKSACFANSSKTQQVRYIQQPKRSSNNAYGSGQEMAGRNLQQQ